VAFPALQNTESFYESIGSNAASQLAIYYALKYCFCKEKVHTFDCAAEALGQTTSS